jgi:cytochrome P450
VCIGSSFALMEATLIMAMMSQRFVYDAAPDHPVEPEATLTLRPRYGLQMRASRRADAPAAVT